MTKQKTSQARYFAARFNPIHEKQAQAIVIIDGLIAQGYTFKDIALDAILLADGRTPEMFDRQSEYQLHHVMDKLAALEGVIEGAVEQLIRRIAAGEIDPQQEMARLEARQPFSNQMQTFMDGFRERSQIGDEL